MTLRHSSLLTLALVVALARSAPAQTVAPPPAIQVWPLGDSITHGYTAPIQTPGGYRAPLRDLLTARGYAVRYVGTSLADSSPSLEATGNSHHDGHSGFRIDQIANNLDGYDNSDVGLGGEDNSGGYWLSGIPTFRPPLSPDLILLDVGANDYFTQYDPAAPGGNAWAEQTYDPASFDAHAAARLDGLIAKLAALRPQATILVASVLPAVYDAPRVAGFNSLLETQIVPKYQALGVPISFVDQNAGFVDPATGAPRPGLYGRDPVHPNAAGYARMAQAWLHGIEAVLPPPVPEPSHTLLLWRAADGGARVWTLDASGRRVARQAFGPEPGWTPLAVSSGPDGAARLLWTNADGRARLRLAGADPAATGVTYGPYTDNGLGLWHATGLAAAPDGGSRLLWNNDDGRVMLWTLDPAFHLTNYAGYGPYAEGSPRGLWSAQGVSVGPDGICRLLWTHASGRAATWAVDDAGAFAVTGGYGPYLDSPTAAPWRATALAVAPDDTLRLLWNDGDGRAALWRVTPCGGVSVTGYGPYPEGTAGSTARASSVSVGPDGVCRLLWTHPDGRVGLWDVGAGGDFAIAAGYGPYPGASALGLSAGP